MRADIEYRSIPGMALVNADRFGDELAILDGDGATSFHEVGEQMIAVARSLVAGGIGPGDRVALWAPNSAPWITAALGILATGAHLVPLNTRFKGAEAAYVLRKSRARTLLCADSFLDFDYLGMLLDADPDLPALRDTAFLGGAASPAGAGAVTDHPGLGTGSTWEDFLSRGDSVDEGEVRARIDQISADDGSDIIFTSGTTGHPKGVRLRHGASLRCYQIYNRSFGLRQGDRIMIVTPFFHCFGYKAGWMVALMAGATSVPVAVFDPESALRLIEDHRITHTGGSPTMFWALLDHPTRPTRDLSSLRVATASAAYVPSELIQRMVKELGVHAITGYGLTEAHALVSVSPPGDPSALIAEWSGQVIEDTEARIVDDAGHDVPLGARGELLVRGFQLMDGYDGDAEATTAAIDAEGWLHTGDVAYMNAEGYVKICDRKKDMFVVGGFNVAPAEVEGLLLECDRIASCAVVGVPDPVWGEVGAAFVVPATAGLTADEVVAWAKDHMANYKVPRHVMIVAALPLNATGKVQKGELRASLLPEPGPSG